MIGIKQKGDFKDTFNFLKKAPKINYTSLLDGYGKEGVAALALATPKASGKTAASWYYTLFEKDGRYFLSWSNSNIKDGVKIAVMIQYGHATWNGAYIEGRDYINPALKPIYDKLVSGIWKGVTTI